MTDRAEQWSDSGLLDIEFYGALRGRTFETAIEAAQDFVGHGMGQRLSPHPLLDVLSLPARVRRAFRLGKVDEVLDHLTGPDSRVGPVGPVAAVDEPQQLRTHLLAVAERLGGRREHRPAAIPRTRVAGRTSVVVLSDDSRLTLRSAASVVRHAGDLDVEVVVVDRGLPPHVVLGLHAWACARFAGTPSEQDEGWLWVAGATRLALRDVVGDAVDTPCTGDRMVLLDASCDVRRGWLPPLLAPLEDSGVAAVQPLLLQPNDTIAAAGLSEAGTPLLVDHPPEDAVRLEGEPVPAISDLAVALRAGDARGSSPAGCLRVASRSWVSTSSRDVGSRFRTTVKSVETSTALRVPTRRAGQLRWSIKLPSSPGGSGDVWGDTHYADAMATSLRRLGQEVVTRRQGAHGSGPVHLDDVSLALRGLHPIPPTPGQRNVLWVISHPENVDPGEFEGYDLVCAASTVWSAEMSARTGREIVPLLQATEFRRPGDARATSGPEASVVFVGTNLGERERPLVWQAVEAGIPLAVYGPGWEGLPEGVWRAAYVPNAQLPDLYRRHGIVLSDHWTDMAQRGFIANRVFDAVACGAAVISDDVVGLHDVFDPRVVVVARTPQDIRDAVDELRARPTTPRDRAAGLHFDARAAVMLDLVLGL